MAAAAEGDGEAIAAAAHAPLSLLPPDLWLRIATLLDVNDIACGVRLACRAMAGVFKAHTTVRLGHPVPPHVFVRRWTGPDALRTLNMQQRKQLPLLVAASGSVANLQMLAARGDVPYLCRPAARWWALAVAAAGAGQLATCHWLYTAGCSALTVDSCMAAAEGGHRHVLEWLLLAQGGPGASDAPLAAARHGHVELTEWLLQLPSEGEMHARHAVSAALCGAAYGCDLATLQRVHARFVSSRGDAWRLEFEALEPVRMAADSPTPDWRAKVEWLEAVGCPKSSRACQAAVRCSDSAARVAWLMQREYPLLGVAEQTVKYGATEVLRNLLAAEYDAWQAALLRVNPVFVHSAARAGHTPVLQLLHEVGAPLGVEAAVAAAAGGQVAVVAWLVEVLGQDVAFTVYLFAAAAESGSSQLLEWLRDRGCPWDASVFNAAARACSEEQLEWLAGRGCPMGEDGTPYVCAAEDLSLSIIRCLRRLGCPWTPDTFTRAARACWQRAEHDRAGIKGAGDWEPVLRALADGGCPIDWEATVSDLRADDHVRKRHRLATWVEGLRAKWGASAP